MMWARCCFLVLAWASLGSCVPARDDEETLTRITRQNPTFGITLMDVRDAILALHRNIRGVASKLDRHEAREAQLAVSTTKNLKSLVKGVTDGGIGVQAVARQMAVMEERLLSLEALIQTTDERQRVKLGQLTQGLDRLLERDPTLQDLPPLPGPQAGPAATAKLESDVLKMVKTLARKLVGVETLIQRDMRAVTNEVMIVGESLGQHMDQLQDRHDRLDTQLGDARESTQASFQQLTDSLVASTAAIQEQVESQSGGGCSGGGGGGNEEMNTCLETLNLHTRQQEENLQSLKQETQQIMEDHLATLQTVLLETYTGQALLNTSVATLTQSLAQINTTTQSGLRKLTSNMQAVKEGSVRAISSLEEKLHEDNTNIMDMLDDRSSQAENLQNTVLENHSELSSEIKSLKKVEQVMIQTADSVLDTKRSIEFGIHQIIFELGEIVKSSGSTINTTLFDQINSISFAILKNQTSALTNMTARMEQEISQVWRQIGIMYQQMTQSVDLLDQLKDTTKEHMNASLSRVGTMDGTVGKINSKVADVESNLNFLLGRLSLVVSEFNLMKSGVGEELMRLRDNMANKDSSPFEFAEGGEPPSDSRYHVARKREAPVSREAAGRF